MADLTKSTNIKLVVPYQCVTRLYEAGGQMNPGDLVYQRASDGKVIRADADDNTTAYAIGIVVSRATNTGFMGHRPPYKAGDKVAVLHQGFVRGYSIAQTDVGKPLWVSTNAGLIETAKPTTAGDTAYAVGRAVEVGTDNDGIIYINPGSDLPAAN